MSQNAAILKRLRAGQPITQMAAARLMGIWRLGARVYDLRQQGWSITTKMIRRAGRSYAEYRMGTGEKP